VHQDVNLFAAELSAVGSTVAFTLRPGRMAYLLCVEGGVTLSTAGTAGTDGSAAGGESCGASSGGSVAAARHDAVELQGQGGAVEVRVSASALEAVEGGASAAHVIMFEMAQDTRGGRGDL